MDYKKLNEHFKNFRQMRRGAKLDEQIVKVIDSSDGEQGASGLSYETYKIATNAGEVFVKLTINTDSYGDNEFVAGIEFVRPIEKNVTVFETI